MNTTTESNIETYLGERFEFKYLLSAAEAEKIEKYLTQVGLELDPYNRDNGPYYVNSLYFDTPTLTDYRDKDGSFLIRKKMRARTYSRSWFDGPERVFLEIKKKRNMNINKVRTEITKEQWNDLLMWGDIVCGDEKVDEFMFLYKRHMYRPHAIISYERTAYMAQFMAPIRITMDKNVEVCEAGSLNEYSERLKVKVTGNQVIMEVKFTGKLPWWFKDMLSRFDIQRTDFSKYRNSVAVLRGRNRIEISK